MKPKLALAALGMAVIMACPGGQTPGQRVYAGYRTFASTAMLLVRARQACVIKSDALWEQIQRLDAVAWAALQAYELAVENGLPGDAEWAAFNAAIDKLLEMYQRLPEPAAKPAADPAMRMEVM